MTRKDNQVLGGSLEALVSDIRACRLCRDAPRGAALPHEPRPALRVSPSARICICGQAPGTRVHASGTPFTDPSGDRLREWMGIGEAEFYDASRIAIIPMGFCFPGTGAGGDMPPRPLCAKLWRERLLDRLTAIQLTLVIGHHATAWHLPGDKRSLTALASDWQSRWPALVVLPHPSPRNNRW
ncbi:MAG: uracil-DNA glycosylase family protein, partial [Rhodomicrobium sp.]|nr:uracil-DNA glycosylase family protein [Rhodomicrobium sp.]